MSINDNLEQIELILKNQLKVHKDWSLRLGDFGGKISWIGRNTTQVSLQVYFGSAMNEPFIRMWCSDMVGADLLGDAIKAMGEAKQIMENYMEAVKKWQNP